MSAPEPQAEASRFGATCMPELTKPPTMAEMLQLAARARAGFLAERARLADAISTAVEAAGLAVVWADPVEEIAAHPAAVRRLRREIFDRSAPSLVLGPMGSLTDLPVIPDDSLPQDEVHLRPHPGLRSEAAE